MREAGRGRVGRQVVQKWETEQMFSGSCELTRQTLLTSLWGRLHSRLPSCIPTVPLGPGS